jgi:hypothetical protein
MKKLFIAFTAAIMAFSLASCDKMGKNTPDGPTPGGDSTQTPTSNVTFNIEITDITSAGATVTVTPSDNNAYYYFDVVSTAWLAEYKMTVEDYAEDDMRYYPEYEYTFDEIASQGKDSYKYITLTPETEYIAYAYTFSKDWKVTSAVATKKFTTQKYQATSTVNIPSDATAVIEDFCDYMNLFFVYIDLDETGNSYLSFAFEAESAEGTFTEADIDSYYGGAVVLDEKNEEYCMMVYTNVTGKYNVDGTYSFQGTVDGGNNVHYVFDVTCTEDEGYEAPAKVQARRTPKHAKAAKMRK